MTSRRRPIVVALEFATFGAIVLLLMVWVESFSAARSFGHEKRFSSPTGWDYTFKGVSVHNGRVAIGKMWEVGGGQAGWMTSSSSRWIAGANSSLWWEFDPSRTFAGFGGGYIYTRPIGLVRRGWAITFPIWCLFLLAVWPAVGWLRRYVARVRANRRIARGECVACGYDLRGIDADRCPECGVSLTGQPWNE
jgi:hypothetical protein